MHHLILILPLLALLLFLFLPLRTALPLYLLVLIGSGTAFWKIWRAQRLPPEMGERAMIGRKAVVLKAGADFAEVEYGGEIWRAASSRPLHEGQTVVIESVEGLTLRVAPLS